MDPSATVDLVVSMFRSDLLDPAVNQQSVPETQWPCSMIISPRAALQVPVPRYHSSLSRQFMDKTRFQQYKQQPHKNSHRVIALLTYCTRWWGECLHKKSTFEARAWMRLSQLWLGFGLGFGLTVASHQLVSKSPALLNLIRNCLLVTRMGAQDIIFRQGFRCAGNVSGSRSPARSPYMISIWIANSLPPSLPKSCHAGSRAKTSSLYQYEGKTLSQYCFDRAYGSWMQLMLYDKVDHVSNLARHCTQTSKIKLQHFTHSRKNCLLIKK